MSILVLNTGSSSLKFALFDDEAREASTTGQVDWHGDKAELTVRPKDGPERKSDCDASDSGVAAKLAIEAVDDPLIAAIGHRIVHGGTRFRESIRIDGSVESEINHLAELAPLHNPPALKAIEAAKAAKPGLPMVAVFDTSFFADLPRSAYVYPVPRAWTDDWGIRKFGFHGISHSYCSIRAAEVMGREAKGLRLVVCHLGNGCSAAAIKDGVAIDTTMGFTPLDGLMMGTRSGEVDPGILLYLMKERAQTVDRIESALNQDSGLLGVSGVSGDYRKVEEAANGRNDQAKLALSIYAARVRSTIGALAATLGGLDALVFAAGVGEHSATLRASVCTGLGFMGIEVDPSKNDAKPIDTDISIDGSPCRILVIHTREELMIAREVARLVESK